MYYIKKSNLRLAIVYVYQLNPIRSLSHYLQDQGDVQFYVRNLISKSSFGVDRTLPISSEDKKVLGILAIVRPYL